MKKKPAARKSAVRNSTAKNFTAKNFTAKNFTAKKSTSLAKAKPDGLGSLIAEVRQLIQSARRGVSSVIDTFQVMTNFEIGRRIVEHEQQILGTRRPGRLTRDHHVKMAAVAVKNELDARSGG